MADVQAPGALDAFRGRSVVSADDVRKEDILFLLDAARAFDAPGSAGSASRPVLEPLLAGRVLGTLFFEPSTRTRLSFESAMVRLGGSVIGFADAKMSSSSKGESLADTVRVVANYCDAIVLRHPMEGAARLAAEVAGIPVINGGDGSNQHPTQTLLDLYTVRKATGRLDGLKIAFMGDLRYGRTVHSLTRALLHFDAELVFIGPPSLRLPEDLRDALRAAGRVVPEVETLDDVGPVDVLYVTRIQKERFPDPLDYERVRNAYRIDRASVERFGPALKILHPLPRVTEVDPDLDAHPGALYFQQARNGVTVRMALLSLILGGGIPRGYA
jgi:aspartate carbamoyltransferase catalytic subunit